MSVILPPLPALAAFTPSLLSYVSDLNGPLGGPTQRLLRLGDRWKVDVVLAPLERGDADAWLAILMAAARDTAVLTWPQPDDGVGNPGAPVVDGAGQAGMTINLRGLTPGYNLNVGQMFSLISGGRRYVHMVTALSVANGSGMASVAITPMLRAQPADGDTVEVVQPNIEGLIATESLNLPYGAGGMTQVKFTLTEQR